MRRLVREVTSPFQKLFGRISSDKHDPLVIADDILSGMKEEILRLEEMTNRQIAAEKRLRRKADGLKVAVKRREQDALLFLRKGDEEKARLALSKQDSIEKELYEVEGMIHEAGIHCDELTAQLKERKNVYNELKEKKANLLEKRNLEEKQSVTSTVGQSADVPPRTNSLKNRTVEEKLTRLKKMIKEKGD